ARRAAPLREPGPRAEDLRRRGRVRQRAMAWPGAGAEEVRERGESGAGNAAGEHAACEHDGVDHRTREPAAGEPFGLAVEEREVEAGVVRDEDGVACEV